MRQTVLNLKYKLIPSLQFLETCLATSVPLMHSDTQPSSLLSPWTWLLLISCWVLLILSPHTFQIHLLIFTAQALSHTIFFSLKRFQRSSGRSPCLHLYSRPVPSKDLSGWPHITHVNFQRHQHSFKALPLDLSPLCHVPHLALFSLPA